MTRKELGLLLTEVAEAFAVASKNMPDEHDGHDDTRKTCRYLCDAVSHGFKRRAKEYKSPEINL